MSRCECINSLKTTKQMNIDHGTWHNLSPLRIECHKRVHDIMMMSKYNFFLIAFFDHEKRFLAETKASAQLADFNKFQFLVSHMTS